jgi:hypothetical protein
MKKTLNIILLGLVAGLFLAGCQTNLISFSGGSKPTASSASSYNAYEIVNRENVPVTLKNAINGDNSVKDIKVIKVVTKDKTQINVARTVIGPKDDFAWAKVLGVILIILGVGCFGASVAKKILGSINAIVGLFAIGWKTSLALVIAGGALYFMQLLLLVVALTGAVWLAVVAVKKDLKDDGRLNGSFIKNKVSDVVSGVGGSVQGNLTSDTKERETINK